MLNQLTMKKALFIIVCMIGAWCQTVQAQMERPKLVVGLVVDQMRWDYLYYFQDLYGEDGINRLLREGFSCENTMIPYIPTVTAIGHASIYTGSTPAMHGLCGNHFFIKSKGVYCCEDDQVQSVGSDTKKGQMSPHLLLASTIGDQLKLATDFRSRVVGVALKDRASILPAGHAADGAFWYDSEAHCFVTSTYYMQELPQWVKDFNKKHKNEMKGDLFGSPDGVTMTFRMAEEALDNYQLGQRGETDMLAVSISSTDVIGHAVGLRDTLLRAAYKNLDMGVAEFLRKLDATVGKGQYLLFLSADHGAAHNYNFLKEHRIPAGGWESWNELKALRRTVAARFHAGEDILAGESSNRFYLDHEKIAERGLKLQEVKEFVMAELRKNPDALYVVDFADAANATMPALLRERICNGYNPDRSGDIIVVMRPQVVTTTNKPDFRGTSHGAWNPYDAHIPCVFMGWNVAHGATSAPTAMTDIAPTVCELLHIQMPNACIGTAITAITK